MRTLAPSNNHNLLRDRWEIPSVDQVMVEERAGASAKRSVKTSAKLQGLKLAISMMDLTTLEGKDTPGKIASLCRKAMRPLGPQCRWTRGDKIDMVIDQGFFLAGEYGRTSEQNTTRIERRCLDRQRQ
jgi:hypothetical protein